MRTMEEEVGMLTEKKTELFEQIKELETGEYEWFMVDVDLNQREPATNTYFIMT